MITLTHNGVDYVNWEEADLLLQGVPQSAIDEAKASVAGRVALDQKRRAIHLQAGDHLSLLGTTADAAAISTLSIAAMVVALSSSQDFASFKASLLANLDALANNNDMVSESTDFLGRVQSGAVRIPVMTKNLADVIAEIETRSTTVSDVLDPQS